MASYKPRQLFRIYSRIEDYPPETLDMAVGRLMSKLSLKDRATLANLAEDELGSLHRTIGYYIRENFFWKWSGNPKLLESCRAVVSADCQNEDDASSAIMKALWETLRDTHKLRLIK
jgi:uncharacterized protein DUF6794